MSTILDEFAPYTQQELWDLFHQPNGSINKHLPVIYSLAVGLNAKRVLDLGMGSTTRTLRAALERTGGVLYSCDIDRTRFEPLLHQGDERWKVYLCPSEEFLGQMDPPFDFAMHDAAHDYAQTRADLERLLPLMRRFSLVCIHDTQHEACGREMVAALHDVLRGFPASYVHLPYCYGLTILRLEESPHEFVPPPWTKGDHGPATQCFPDLPGRASAWTLIEGRLKAVLRSGKRAVKSILGR